MTDVAGTQSKDQSEPEQAPSKPAAPAPLTEYEQQREARIANNKLRMAPVLAARVRASDVNSSPALILACIYMTYCLESLACNGKCHLHSMLP